MTPASHGAFLELLASVGMFVLLLAPVGYALLRALTRAPQQQADLALALGVGFAAVMPLLLAEAWLRAPILVLPATVLSVISLRNELKRLLEPRGLAALLALPLLLASLAVLVDGGDMRVEPAGLSFRVGFDVSDRAFYAMVAQEMRQAPPPITENPLFAGVPFPYSFFPALAGLLIQRYAGAPLLGVFLCYLPAAAFLFIGLAIECFLREIGTVSRVTRALTALLVVLGGDLSFLVPAHNLTALERTRGFLVFHSFSAECLYYNPWMFGLPLVLVWLTLARRWLRGGGREWLMLVGLVSGALWETKLFALLPLCLGAFVGALLSKRSRLLALASVAVAGALPWVLLTSLSGSSREGSPLAPWLLYPVRVALGVIFGPGFAASLARDGLSGAVALGLFTVPFLVGALGVRLLGLPRLVVGCRSSDRDLHLLIAISLGSAACLGLLLVGNPVPTDGVQFLILPQLLTWLYAGPALAAWLAAPSLAARAVGCMLLALAVGGPGRYLALKLFPESFTAEGSMDRRFQLLSRDARDACAWLAEPKRAAGRVMVPLGGDPEDVGGLKPFYIAAASGHRLVAVAGEFNLSPRLAETRRRAVQAFYETQSADEAERILESWAVRWVWEQRGSPLRFRSARLSRAFSLGEVTLYEFR